MRVVALLALALFSIGCSAANKLVWESLYAPPYADIPATVIVSLSCINRTLCYIPGGSNGVGFLVYKFNGQPEGTWEPINVDGRMLMMLSITMGTSASGIHGAVGGPEILDVVYGMEYFSQANNSFQKSIMPFQLASVVQSLSSMNGAKIILGADDGTSNGIYYSADGGAAFAFKPTTGIPTYGNCSTPSYVQLINENEWFLTAASLPPQNNSVSKLPNGMRRHRKTHGTSVEMHPHTRAVRFAHHTPAEIREYRRQRVQAAKKNSCSYAGSIAHTTDGGQTYKALLNSNDFAFSTLSCFDAQTCSVLAFNDLTTRLYTTTDGINFKLVLTVQSTDEEVQDLSIVKYRSKTEVWAAGGMQTQTSMSGLFYFSKDGGLTWVKYPIPEPNIGAVMDMSFTPDGDGFAAAITQFQTSTILRYAVQPYYGYFTQKQCPLAGCSLLCNEVTFPQGMCLPAQGGSIEAFCGTDALLVRQYSTTSCVGTYTNSTAPLNQCLKDSQGNYFENLCGPGVASKVHGPARFVRHTQ